MKLPESIVQKITALKTKAALFDQEARNAEAKLPKMPAKYQGNYRKYIEEQKESARRCREAAANIQKAAHAQLEELYGSHENQARVHAQKQA